MILTTAASSDILPRMTSGRKIYTCTDYKPDEESNCHELVTEKVVWWDGHHKPYCPNCARIRFANAAWIDPAVLAIKYRPYVMDGDPASDEPVVKYRSDVLDHVINGDASEVGR